MADYGVVPTGFARKPLDRILFELEQSAKTIFGPDAITDSESPMGQFIGLFALLSAQLWELGEDVYQSYDPDQAEELRLNILARIRLLERGAGESDIDFRKAITNKDRARNDIQDLARAVFNVDGVTYTQVFVNDTSKLDANGLSPGQIAVAVLGGDDNEVATEARRYIVPGVSTFGNVVINTVIDGYCRSLNVVRPILVPVTLTVNVRTKHDRLGCPPPSTTAIRTGLIEDFTSGDRSLLNGDDITLYRIRSAIEARHPTVEVISFVGERDGTVNPSNVPVNINFIEMATLAPEDITVVVLPDEDATTEVEE